MEMLNITPMLVNKEFRTKIYEHYMSNKIISSYYTKLAEEYNKKPKMKMNILNKQSRLEECNQYWTSERYNELNINKFKKTYYCKDKFCLNCKKWRQAQRTKKFLPELQKYDKDLYFITFTIPNVQGIEVKETINKIFKAHRKLIRILSGLEKCKIFNSEVFNFIGGIRVLEISINRDRKEKYHVHLHCAYILKDYEYIKGTIQNQFSIDHSGKRDYIRLFNKQEVELQKIWFYLYNEINLKSDAVSLDNYKVINTITKRKVTIKNKGYSVQIDKFSNGEYSEMFKYMIKDKASYINDEGEKDFDILNFDEFKTLYFSTANVRQLEAYGVLKHLNDEEEINEEVHEVYEKIVEFLNKYDIAYEINEHIEEVNRSEAIYISKNKIYSFLKKYYFDDDEEEYKNIEKNKPTAVNNRFKMKDFKLYELLINDMIKDEKIKQHMLNNKIFNPNEYKVTNL